MDTKKFLAEIIDKLSEITQSYSVDCVVPITFSFKNFLIRKIHEAEHYIYIATFNIQGASTETRFFWQELAKAVERGVKVKVLVNTRFSTERGKKRTENSIEFIKSLGIEVIPYPPARVLHLKLILIDYEDIIIGSHNLTENCFNRSVDLSLYLKSESLHAELKKFYETICECAEYENFIREQKKEIQARGRASG